MTPKGFKFSAVNAGIKKDKKEDIGIIVSDSPCNVAGVFTRNMVKAAPVIVDMEHLKKSPKHLAVICNSGCANAGTGKQGMKDAITTATLLAKELGCSRYEMLVASTGCTVELMPMPKVIEAIPKLAEALGKSYAGFARAIMTTDLKPKTAKASIKVDGKLVTIFGIAKGSGMIHPNMATMLGFIVTDASIGKALLKSVLKEAVDGSFNRITVDGDTSTNDSVIIMANGMAGNKTIKKGTAGHKRFAKAVGEVCLSLAESIVVDGEGATCLAEIKVEKAKTKNEAIAVARSIAGSLLVKTALHGRDPNWGRILVAAGYSGVAINPDKMELYFGKHCAYRKGVLFENMESKLSKEMKKKKVPMRLVLNMGKASASYLFCDLSKDYVTINADYRS